MSRTPHPAVAGSIPSPAHHGIVAVAALAADRCPRRHRLHRATTPRPRQPPPATRQRPATAAASDNDDAGREGRHRLLRPRRPTTAGSRPINKSA